MLAQGYKKFGINRVGGVTTYREWAPAAQAAWLIGDFNDWEGTPLEKDEFGVWSVSLPDKDGAPRIPHKSHVKVRLQHWDGWTIDLVPAWMGYAVMPPGMGATFDGVHWDPPASEKHVWCEPCPVPFFGLIRP
jgi:1,4-alpha-glucan branching enzyme